MTDQTVVPFPVQDVVGDPYEYWLGCVECELSILGHNMKERAFDWRAAYQQGRRPEQVAAEVAMQAESADGMA